MSDEIEQYEILNIPYFQQFAKGEGVKIAVMDSELILSHGEFNGSNIEYKEFINSVAYNYHGTATSSLIVGQNIGVAPKAELLHLKMLSDVYGSGFSWDKAMSYAMRSNVDLICMSLGTKDNLSTSMRQSIQRATENGILIFAPSGNEGRTLLRNPADNPNVVAVGGIDLDKKIAKKSNRSKFIEGYAPSENIFIADGLDDSGYSTIDGTSFANAIFVGQFALILSYVRMHNKEINLRDFLTNYNIKYRADRKILDMKKVKEELDILLNL